MYKIVMVYMNHDNNVGVGAGSIASVVLHHGHNLKFFDTAYSKINDIVDDIKNNNYDFLFISTSTLLYKNAVVLAEYAKRVSNNIKILIGGIHITIMRKEVFKQCQHFDFGCIGEGDDFIADFLDAYGTPNFFNIKNLIYRDVDGVIKENDIRPCTNLDKIPSFRWDLFSGLSIVNSGPLPGFCYVFATRGCPFRCSYCCNSFWLELYKKDYLRKKNIDKVISELLFLKAKYPVEIFYLADEMLLYDMPYVVELLNRIKTEVKLPYGCMSRVEKINPDVIKLFTETGCKYIGMGVECGDEQFRKQFLNRHMTNEQIIYAFTELRKVPGIKLSSYNMKCFPVDYDDDLTKKTIELNNLIKPDFVGMSIFYPFPGTDLYKYCVEHNKIDYSRYGIVDDYYTKSVLKR